MNPRIKLAAAMIAAAGAPPLLAQGVATELELTPVTVSGEAALPSLDPTLPTSSFSVSREALEGRSFVNTEDALGYAPNTTVRKRFIGDRNANLGGRSFGTTQPARGLAYVDGYLISNFLGRFDAPRWNIVAPEEVARTDVLYGPFSALYPGNSIGSTVAITTRTPTGPEGSARALVYRQRHEDYGLEREYGGDQESAFAANRWGALSLAVAVNRLAYESHPMAYATASPSTDFNVAGLPVVSGAVFDRDPSGNRRVVLGATGMQDGVQELAKLRLVYDFGPALQADSLYARWRNDYRVSNQTLLRDREGREVWKPAGALAVNIDGARYLVPTLAPQRGLEEHEQWGGRLRTRHATGWNQSVQVSRYRVLTNTTRQANVSDPFAGGAVAGTDTVGDGTGWTTLELQASYTPAGAEGHALTFGYHHNRYTLENRVFDLADWHAAGTRTGERENNFGKTEIRALYAQDVWRFAERWTATLGLRLERFRAHDGSQFVAAASSAPNVAYDDREASAGSPKFSLAYLLGDEWVARASLGRGVRFPTVSELFQGTRSGTTIFRNDPDLRAETSNAKELALVRERASSTLRISLFEDDVRDAIFLQQQTVGATTVSTVQNVGRVRTRGLEVAYQGADVYVQGLDLQASLALVRPEIIEDAGFPAAEGKDWPRVPRLRASLLTSYRTGPWLASLGVRHSGRQYGTLDNSDRNGDTFGGISGFTVADAKLGHALGKRGSVAVGIDNLTDRRYYVHHPYPGRTGYVELKLAL